MTILPSTRFITVPLIIALLATTIGCQRAIERTIVRQALPPGEEEKILRMVLSDGSQIVFDDEGGWVQTRMEQGRARNFVVGRTGSGDSVAIAQERVLEATLQKQSFDAVGTAIVGATTVTAALFALFLIALSNWH